MEFMKNRSILLQLLQTGCKKLNLNLSEEIQAKLVDYVLLLEKWNTVYNLTAIQDPKEMVVRHILDSLSVAPYIVGNSILDVGSGAGLPGIPLALLFPEKHFVLLDSNNKKTRFLFHVISSLKILNIEIVNQRVENYTPNKSKVFNGFDIIITRAFSSLRDMVNKTKNLYNSNGCLLAMKGKIPKQEIEEIDSPIMVYNLNVPLLNEERHLISIKIVNHE